MSRTTSPSSKRPYGVARVVAVWGLARSSFYAARHRQEHPREPAKRGPKALSDQELITAIRQLLDEAMFAGEGYRKIWARLRFKGVRTSKTAYCDCSGAISCYRRPGNRSRLKATRMRERLSPRFPIRCGVPMPPRRSLKRKAQ